MLSDLFIGVDIGTTAIKGVLTDRQGTIVASSSSHYSLEMNGDICEVEAELYWEMTIAVIKELVEKIETGEAVIRAISFASQGETLIVVDENGFPIRKAIVWLDNRSFREAELIKSHFGLENICLHTGQPIVQPLWPATRILWLQKNEPITFRKTHKFLLVEDFILFKLTSKYVTEETLVSSTLYFDIKNRKWWPEMLQYLNISEDKLPTVFPSGQFVDNLTDAAVLRTGLSKDTRVITGAYDHVAGAIGAGNIKQGLVSETTGASMAMVVTLDHAINNFNIGVPMQCHALSGKYLLLPYGQTAGMVLKWFKDQFCSLEIDLSEHDGIDVFDKLTQLAEKIAPGADGLIMLPHLSGSGSPEFDVHARGAFVGVTPMITKAHFIRAILESIACMVTSNIEMVKQAGIPVNAMYLLGGGAKSSLWNQIKADMANIPVTTLQGQSTTALGAAILATVGAGYATSIEQACKNMVNFNSEYQPSVISHERYKPVLHRYKKLTHALKNYW